MEPLLNRAFVDPFYIVPAHRTSMLVVCPLQRGVSRHMSASLPLLTCSSLAATLLNITLFGSNSIWCIAVSTLDSPAAGNLSSQSTEYGTLFSISTQLYMYTLVNTTRIRSFSPIAYTTPVNTNSGKYKYSRLSLIGTRIREYRLRSTRLIPIVYTNVCK